MYLFTRSLLLLWLLSGSLVLLNAQTVVLTDLTSPIGLTFDSSGYLWLTEAGSGQNDGQVSRLAPDGTRQIVITGLPSHFDTATEETAGPWRVYFSSLNELIVVVGEGPDPLAESLLFFDPSDVGGDEPLTPADANQVLSIGTFTKGQGAAESNPYSVAEGSNGDLFIVDAAANMLVRYYRLGDSLGIVAEWPPFPNPLPFGPPFVDPVPTRILARPDGGFYVAQLTGFPFINGAANVYEVTADGQLSVFAENLILLTDLAIDPTDSQLVALQFAEFGEMGFAFNSAKAIKLYADGSRDTLASNFGPAAGLAFAADGTLYTTHLFLGQLLRFGDPTSTRDALATTLAVVVYPNPFREEVILQYELESAAEVQLAIYDASGRLIYHSGAVRQAAGRQSLSWTAPTAAPGLYFYRLTAGERTASGRLLRR